MRCWLVCVWVCLSVGLSVCLFGLRLVGCCGCCLCCVCVGAVGVVAGWFVVVACSWVCCVRLLYVLDGLKLVCAVCCALGVARWVLWCVCVCVLSAA